MKGKIHYSKLGHIQVVGEDNRVYYTGIPIKDSTFANREKVEYEIIDKDLSLVKINAELTK